MRVRLTVDIDKKLLSSAHKVSVKILKKDIMDINKSEVIRQALKFYVEKKGK